MSRNFTIKLLNATELLQQANAYTEIDGNILTRGLKGTFPTNTDEERALVKSYQDDLRKVLSMERVALRHERSIAIIEDGKIRLTKRQGKWDVFESAGQYLEPHVALFLMEINRLEVYLGKIIVSLERAYHMFLAHENNPNEGNKLTKSEYIVYGHFMRFGCNIRRFKNESYMSSDSESDSVDLAQTSTDIQKSYIWHNLYELLGHGKSAISSNSIDTCRYKMVRDAMNTIIYQFKGDGTGKTKSNDPTNEINKQCSTLDKRKLSDGSANDVPACKLTKIDFKRKTNGQYFGSGSTNDFMVGNTFQRFKQIFDKIDYIDVKKPDAYDFSSQPINGKFSFDLWASFDHRKPQFNGPDFRLIVKQPSKSLPHNDDIFRLYNTLEHKSAVVLICTNEEMSFQAYVYRFTS